MDKGFSGLNEFKTSKKTQDGVQINSKKAPYNLDDNMNVIKNGNSAFKNQKEEEFALKENSPIKIPKNAKIKKESKKLYKQVKYSWEKGKYKYEARWHTKTPNSPINSDSWVVSRKIPGNAKGTKAKIQILSGNRWISLKTWQNAIKARKNGNATKKQINILNKGHFTKK